MSLRDQILAASDFASERVSVPEWGVEVEIRSITTKQRARLVRSTKADDPGSYVDQMLPDLIIASAHDPASGERLFGDADKAALLDKSPAVLERHREGRAPRLGDRRGRAGRSGKRLRADSELRFRHRLALALGRTVAELDATLSSRELVEWMAFWQLEPFGGPQEDYRSGLLAMLFYNAHKGKGGRTLGIADFFPSLGEWGRAGR